MSEILQQELRQLFAKAKMPSSPTLAVHILELAEDPDSTVEQFADLIQMDPALTARLLSMTNSAASGQRHEVTTIHRAVSLLGINRVRAVSLGFQLVGHLDRLGSCKFDMKQFWQKSLLRACIGHEFAEALGLSCADEAFLIGLLLDCGTLLLVQLIGEPYAALCQDGSLSPSACFAAENRNHPYNHAQAMAALAREWKLPEVIAANVENHHIEPPLVPDPTEADLLRSLIHLVGSVRLASTHSVDTTEPALAALAQQHLGMDTQAVQSALSKAAQAYAEMAGILQGVLPYDLDVTDLLSQANAHLTMSVETQHRQSSEEQAQLEHALGEYRERAARDPLTGLLNRGALTDAVRESVQQARHDRQAVTILFMDLDNFKRINDTLGHQAGDDVIRAVAEILKAKVPNAGTAGRYGGEEFILAATGLTERNARKLAQGVLKGIRRTRFPGLALPGPVTCSLGGVWGVPDPDVTAESLIKFADELMYQAKRSGKDRCCFRDFHDVYNIDLLDSDGDTVDACTAAVVHGAGRSADRTILPPEYQSIAQKLDRHTPRRFLNLRKSKRKQLFAPCKLTLLVGPAFEFESADGYVRNISTGGIAILTTRSMLRGQPIEVSIIVEDNPTLFVAGIVAFCRHVEGVIHEVGVQLFTHAKQPILSDDPDNAIRNLDWLALALESMQPAEPASV